MNDDIDPDQREIMGLLEPYLDRIYPRFPAAMALYNEIPAHIRAEHDDRAAASATWCHVWSDFQREFAEEPGFHFLEVRNLHLLNIRDRLLIRAKWKLRHLGNGFSVIRMSKQVGDENLLMPYLRNSPTREP